MSAGFGVKVRNDTALGETGGTKQSSRSPARRAIGARRSLSPMAEMLRDRALHVLLSAELASIVDMVQSQATSCTDTAASAAGSATFRGTGADGFETLAVEGTAPFANQSAGHLAGLDAELTDPHPDRAHNAYPFAYEQTAQLFDHPAAPDVCVVHSADHNWEDDGGHRGEHGSLGVLQARAPFVFAGKGVRRDGLVPRVARLVDVAPTIAALLGVPPCGDGTYLAGQDGHVRQDVLDDSERPEHVVGFLLDGANLNVLYALAASGDAPNIARLMELGTAYEWGAIAGMPTVTLANHTP